MTLTSNLARALLASALSPRPRQQLPRRNPRDLTRLKAHIAAVQTMTANFTQTDARGRSAAGTLQLKRPGSVRFQYGSGDLLLVANGKTLTFIDYQVGQKSSWPLGRTPLGSAAFELPRLQWQGRDPAERRSRASWSPEPANTGQYGQLTLAFLRSASAPGGLQLYGWTAIDPQKRADDGQAVQRALQRCRPGKRVHLRRAEEAIG